MNTLIFKVNGESIKWVSGYEPTSGEKNYSKLRFEFNEDWKSVDSVSVVMFFDVTNPVVVAGVEVKNMTAVTNISKELRNQSGILHIGVIGVKSDDPEVTLSSHIAFVPVGKGVNLTGTESTALLQDLLEYIARLEGRLVDEDNPITSELLKKGVVENKHLSAEFKIVTSLLENLSVTTEKLANLSVSGNKIQNGAVENKHLSAEFKIVTSLLENLSVTTEKLANLSVSENKIQNGAVTGVKIADHTIGRDKLEETYLLVSSALIRSYSDLDNIIENDDSQYAHFKLNVSGFAPFFQIVGTEMLSGEIIGDALILSDLKSGKSWCYEKGSEKLVETLKNKMNTASTFQYVQTIGEKSDPQILAYQTSDPTTKSELRIPLSVLRDKLGGAGKSAYQIAVDNGFKGTEDEWLESLKGEDGRDAVVDVPDPNCHAEYFEVSAEGVLSLRPEYRGASSNTTYINSVSDRGAGYVGSLNEELPKDLVIPEVVNKVAVVSLSNGMLLDNTVIESLTFPSVVTDIPEQFANQAYNLRTLNNTEHIKTIGEKAFRSCRLEKLYLPNLETLSGIATFANNPTLISAEVGKITTLPTNTFGMAQALREVTSAGNVKTIGQQALYNTPKLESLDFIGGVTSIAKGGLWRTGFDYDWSSLSNCTFGDYATTKQSNPTDFWSALTPTPCENPLPTRFCQKDPRWVNKKIGATERKYGSNGCGIICAMHAYCGVKNLALSSVDEFEELAADKLDSSYVGYLTDITEILNDMGVKATYHSSSSGWNSTNLNTLYTTLKNGGYAIVTMGTPSGHTIVVYGVNENKELLYLDSERFYFYDTSKYSMGKLPYEKLIAQKTEFILVTA